MEILAKLFGSAHRVKIMRLFLMNPDELFDRKDIARRTKVSPNTVRRELRLLAEIGLVKERAFLKLIPKKDGLMEKVKASGWGIDPTFLFLTSLRALVTEVAIGKDDVAARFKEAGQVKLLIIAGIFIDEPDSRVDILIVGDKLKKQKIDGALRKLESELGKELSYGILDTTDYKYRLGIYDKFVRDILDYPHQVVVDKLHLG